MEPRDVHCTTSELAAELHVDPSTLRRWVDRGVIIPAFTTPGGHHRFVAADVRKQLATPGAADEAQTAGPDEPQTADEDQPQAIAS